MTTDSNLVPEKARLLDKLREGGFSVPPFLYLPAEDFKVDSFNGLKEFLEAHCQDFKIIVRSCHPAEEFYRGGTFDSLETYSDLAGVKYARNKIIKLATTEKRLSILRQQKFQCAPELDMDLTGVMVMPFIEGTSVMAKVIGESWEFGYSRSRSANIKSEPYITNTPHDRRLLNISQEIEEFFGFKCEIEFIVSKEGEIFVVQAKDISKIETLEMKIADRSIRLAGLLRYRKRRTYRERPIYVMDNKKLYLDIISRCEDLVLGCSGQAPSVDEILARIERFEQGLEEFALRYERFCVLGLSIEVPEDIYQVANHYLDDSPEDQQALSRALHRNQYKIDQFLAEADTLIARDKFRRNLCSHDAYGINTVRNPIWSAYWTADQHRFVIGEFRRLGYRTGDYIGIHVDENDLPVVYRL